MQATQSSQKKRSQIDTPWKNILAIYFRQFIEYCWPNIAQEVNWEKEYEVLDKELNTIARETQTGNRLVDKLIKLWLKTGQETWVLCHVEVQGHPDKFFSKRMFIYRYRLQDRYQKPIISMAILVDKNSHWRPDCYREDLLGCSIEMRFLIVKILDYAKQRAELEASLNPFATVILAQLMVLESNKDPPSLYNTKIDLTRRLYKKGWQKNEILELYFFIDWLIALPDELMIKYHEQIENLEEEKKMAFISTAERIGRRRGWQEGMEKGIETGIERGIEKGIAKGINRGKQQGTAAIVTHLLKCRFGEISAYNLQLVQNASEQTLLIWASKILVAQTIEEVFGE